MLIILSIYVLVCLFLVGNVFSWKKDQLLADNNYLSCHFPSLSYQSLRDLYLSTNGSDWRWKGYGQPWNFSIELSETNNPCVNKWEGIQCFYENSSIFLCDIYNITLNQYQLHGTLPQSLVNITQLTILSLQTNHLYSTIPSLFTQFTNLTIFQLDFNQLTGSLPHFSPWNLLSMYTLSNNLLIGSLSSNLMLSFNLQTIDFSSNKLTGTIPLTISNLNQLTYFNLYNNRIAGSIPYQMQSCSLLRYVDLSQNKLAGTLPRYLFLQLTDLQIFNVETNKIIGNIPSSIGPLMSLHYLNLAHNKLTGSVPFSIGNLTSLTSLYLFNNALIGSIPSTIGSLTSLEILLLNNNKFTGAIPSSLGKLSNTLWDLSLRYNQLTGSIPLSFSNLLQLTILDISSNQLTGTIPIPLMQCSQLQTLYLYDNLFSGKLPENIGQLTALQSLYLYSNQFTNSLPTSITQLRQIQNVILSENLFEGLLPTNISQWNQLLQFEIYENQFTNQLPSLIGNWINLTSFQIDNNYFSQSFPVSISQLTHLQYLNCFLNLFSGNIFMILNQNNSWNELIILDLHHNILTGSLPSIMNYTSIAYFDIHNNQLIGKIPVNTISTWKTIITIDISCNSFQDNLHWIESNHNNLHELLLLNISTNQFSGSLTSSLYQLTQLQYLDLSNNQFTGTISFASFSSFSSLFTLILKQNRLSGSLFSLPATITQFDISQNYFQGTIPIIFTNESKLTLFSIGQNCLEGTIPSYLCDGKYLQTIVLDGLYHSCDRQIFQRTSIYTYLLTHPISGSIPLCLFAMNSLQTLHISSNGIRQTLPTNITISTTLKYLSLSHNYLVGTIPTSIQSHSWNELDLSFNKLQGTLLNEMKTNTTLSNSSLTLEMNRLYGIIPHYLYDINIPINVLNGNFFTCRWFDSNLPSSDVNAQNYFCVSNHVLTTIYLFLFLSSLIIFIGLFIFILFYFNFQHSLQSNSFLLMIKGYYHFLMFTSSEILINQHLRSILFSLQQLRVLYFYVLLWALVILLPIYCILSNYFGYFNNSLIWLTSIGYLSGQTCAIILYLMLLLTLFYLWMLFNRFSSFFSNSTNQTNEKDILNNSETNTKETNDEISSNKKKEIEITRNYMILMMIYIGIINVSIVLTINMLFVYANSLSLSSNVLVGISICMTIFKLLWTKLILIHLCEYFLSSSMFISSEFFLIKTHFLIFLTIFNYVIAPIIAEIFISNDCFYYTIVPFTSIEASYTSEQCYYYVYYDDSNDISCGQTGLITHSTSYQPSFQYSYQCTSSLLSIFIPIYLYRYLLNIFVWPIILWLLKRLQQYSQQTQQTSVLSGYLYRILTKLLPRLWKLNAKDSVLSSTLTSNLNISDPNKDIKTNINHKNNSEINPIHLEKVVDIVVSDKNENNESNVTLNNQNQIILIEYLVSNIVGELSIMISFGYLFPINAFIAFISLLVDSFLFQCGLARAMMILSQLYPVPMMLKYQQYLKQQCQHLVSLIVVGCQTPLLLSCILFSFFLYDISGDEVGSISALWIFSFIGCYLLIGRLISLFKIQSDNQTNLQETINKIKIDSTVEMCELHVITEP